MIEALRMERVPSPSDGLLRVMLEQKNNHCFFVSPRELLNSIPLLDVSDFMTLCGHLPITRHSSSAATNFLCPSTT